MHDVGADTISLTGHIFGNMFLFIKLIISKSNDFRFIDIYHRVLVMISIGEELLKAMFMVV